MNVAKARLAYEITKLIHGEEEADKAQNAAQALFANKADSEHMPSVEIEAEKFNSSRNIVDILAAVGLASSKGEARRLIQQGGISLNDKKIADITYTVADEDVNDGSFILRKGKKVYIKVIIKN